MMKMIKIVNRLNNKWNQSIYWFHDVSVKINIRWLVVLSIWACDRLIWQLPNEWQLVNGMPLREYLLLHELEVARHQIQYFVNYAYDLQSKIILLNEEMKEENSGKELLTVS